MKNAQTVRRLSRGLLLAGLTVMLAMPSIAEGQGTRGEIAGRVTDDTGGVLPGVTVAVTNQETGMVRSFVSNEAGRYIASNLPPGPYELHAQLSGFRPVVRRNVQVSVGSQLVIDFELGIGDFEQVVEVVADTPLVDTSSAGIGGVVSREMIENLPMNARSFDQLATLQAGVVLTKNQTRSFQGGATTKMSIRGARSDQNKLLLDGTDVGGITNELPGSVAGTSLGVDSVREFKVEVGTYSAEHGGAAGGVITVVTKSGTNTFSGTAFEFHRNDSLDAKNYFDVGDAQPDFTRNQFGFSAGGPILRKIGKNLDLTVERACRELAPVDGSCRHRTGLEHDRAAHLCLFGDVEGQGHEYAIRDRAGGGDIHPNDRFIGPFLRLDELSVDARSRALRAGSFRQVHERHQLRRNQDFEAERPNLRRPRCREHHQQRRILSWNGRIHPEVQGRQRLILRAGRRRQEHHAHGH